MRAQEFVDKSLNETFNPDCFDPAFNDTQHFDGLTYRANGVEDPNGMKYFEIRVFDDDFQRVGLARFKPSKGGVSSVITSFKPEYQGQGIARNIYAYVRMMGNTIVPSRNQLAPGKAMWDSWKKTGDAKHLMRESASEREIAQVQYMQGECAVLALTIHKMDPQRFPLGFVYEFFDAVPDMYIEPDEFDDLDHARQQDIQYNHENWTLTHAYVYDVKTKEYIDAEGRHNQLPTIGRDFNATRHNKFPAEVQDLVRVSHYMEWDEAQEKWIVLSGWDALDKAYTPEGQQRAREYAIKYLGIDRPAQGVAEGVNQVDFNKNLLTILQQKYPGIEFSIQLDRVESADGELTVIANIAEQGSYVGCFMWDVSTGPYTGALGLAIKQTTDQLLQANPGKKPALFIGGDNENPEAWAHIADKLNYKLITDDDELEEGVAENFADGKNPGRKGLAKRSGVNTKASVSSLRKTAKHSSGEKQRMAHWLANMKAGRAKANKK